MSARGAVLIVVAGPARGRVIALDQVATIGRDEGCALVIADLALSRRHCVVDSENGVLTIRDLDSLNGTLVNGVPVRAHTLFDGDQIRVGDSALLFVAPNTPDTTAGVDSPSDQPPADWSSTVTLSRDVVEQSGGIAQRFSTDITLEHDLIGDSRAMQDVYLRVARAAPTEATVLVRGESGTGKELVARALHANSARAGGPFVTINCAALPEGLLESELFGHEKGAFTGALVQKRGRLELADKGSAFFDEIGELAPPLQAKLLRVLQQREIERVGGIRPLPLNIRVIAATNRDLEAAVKQGAFRQDLFYRLNVVAVVVPPLRERREDLPLLITYFVRKYSTTCQRRIRGVTREARARLLAYEWPGNVRELENAIERAVVLGSGEWITLEDLPEHVLEEPASVPSDVGYHASVNAAKRQIIRDAVVRAGGNCAQAARVLQLQPTYLHRLLRNLGIKEHVQRSPSE